MLIASGLIGIIITPKQANASETNISFTSDATRDGYIESSDTTWNDARDGSNLLDYSTYTSVSSCVSVTTDYKIRRSYISFNTSSLPDSSNLVITNATVNIRGYSDGGNAVSIQKADIGNSLGIDDWNSYSGNYLDLINSWDSSGWNEFEIPQSAINVSGWSDFCLREYDHDYQNTEPSSDYLDGMYFGDDSTHKPILNITYIILPPPSITNVNRTKNQIVFTFDKGENASHTVIRYKTTGFPTNETDGTLAYNGTGTTATIALNQDTYYYFKFFSYNSTLNVYSINNTTYTITPIHPLNFQVEYHNNTHLNISWSNYNGSDFTSTLVRVKSSGYPSSPTDGTLVYNGTGNYTYYPFTYNSPLYFSAWTYTTSYSEQTNATWGYLKFYITKSETDSTTTNFNLYMSNGTLTIDETNVSSPKVYNYTQYPIGNDVYTRIYDSSGNGRILYLDLQPNIYYNYSIPLVEGANIAIPVEVYDIVDNPLENAIIKIYYNDILLEERKTNTAGSGGTVFFNTSLLYYFEVTCPGYTSLTQFYSPSTADSYIRFILKPSSGGNYTFLFDDIGYSIMPSEGTYHNQINISATLISTSNSLEWYNMTVYYKNNLSASWSILSFHNSTSPSGATFNESLTNNGRYYVSMTFKKSGYQMYHVGDFVYTKQNLTGLSAISWNNIVPDDIYLLVLFILMLLATAFFYPFAGNGSIWIGMGVFAFGMILNPISIDLVGFALSGWNLLIIMVLTTLSLWLLMERI